MKHWSQWPINKVELNDLNYPKLLKRIKKPPKQIYYRGNWNQQIFKNCLAVVGTRKMTAYGESVVEKILPAVVEAGVTIVSGFMYGVDTKAHQVCLDNQGETIAVLGSGLNQPTPKRNDQLYSRILDQKGLVLSEYQNQQKARLWTFPQRNRIVAGLSKASLIIEGGEKSGTLITAKLTKQQGKTILAVPGPVGSSMSEATNFLLKTGAKIVTTGEEILNHLGIQPTRSVLAGKKWPGVYQQIIEELKRESLTMDELSRILKINISQLSQKLSELQLKGAVKEKIGKYFIN